MKKEIDILKESQKVLSKLDQGVLLTTKYKEKVNTMTIGWGTIGIEWGLPIFIAFVRTSRYTKEMSIKMSKASSVIAVLAVEKITIRSKK